MSTRGSRPYRSAMRKLIEQYYAQGDGFYTKTFVQQAMGEVKLTAKDRAHCVDLWLKDDAARVISQFKDRTTGDRYFYNIPIPGGPGLWKSVDRMNLNELQSIDKKLWTNKLGYEGAQITIKQIHDELKAAIEAREIAVSGNYYELRALRSA